MRMHACEQHQSLRPQDLLAAAVPATSRAMHNKPFKVDCSKIAAVLPGFSFIPVDESARAAAACIVAMGLAAAKPAGGCCAAPRVWEDEQELVAAAIVPRGSGGGVLKLQVLPREEGGNVAAA